MLSFIEIIKLNYLLLNFSQFYVPDGNAKKTGLEQ